MGDQGNDAAASVDAPDVDRQRGSAVTDSEAVVRLSGPVPEAARSADLRSVPAAAGGDGRERIAVSSWWKLGGSNADLNRALKSCIGKLGKNHRPEFGATVVTAALQSCLRTAGWCCNQLADSLMLGQAA